MKVRVWYYTVAQVGLSDKFVNYVEVDDIRKYIMSGSQTPFQVDILEA